MPYENSVHLMGNLTADLELKKTPTGESVLNFTVAINHKDRDGKSHAEFFPCEAWGGWAENLARSAKKGSLVIVKGRLRHETWQDKSTNSVRSKLVVRATRVFHVESRFRGEEEPVEGDEAGH